MLTCLRSSCSGSDAHARKTDTSLAICEAVAGVPSGYSTAPSMRGGGMAMDAPLK